MTKIKTPKESELSVSEWKFLKEIKWYFWVEAKEIKAILKALDEANGDHKILILTEQFNLWVIEWMKQAAKDLEKFFAENVKEPIQDFKEVDPEGNVVTIEDIVVTEEITDSNWKI